MSDLDQQISEHRAALALLERRIDQVLLTVETLTVEARARLAEYQDLKQAAGQSLGAAGRQFLAAHHAFGKAEELHGNLEALKRVHVDLSNAVNDLVRREPDSPEARRVLDEFMGIRRTLRKTYRRIERCRKEARIADAGPGDNRDVSMRRGAAGARATGRPAEDEMPAMPERSQTLVNKVFER